MVYYFIKKILKPPRTSPQQDASVTGGPPIPPPPSSSNPHPAPIQVRAVEIGIVMMVLLVWAGAIALFFNRWGKIRMLLPYQPDYKEQLKVPGTGAICNPTTTPCTQHSSQHACSQVMTTLSDMVMQCGGGGCGVLEQCFHYQRRTREPRECGCQFALLHRADIA
ncbi:hypothetical protein KQX54_020079 [Cotesia glomerata]|uniref:Fibronectin type III domain-containing protein n=1 Tax=Cotesia glomerata TaxID=32391 RepID=A0AAV7J0K4_COTGL|nr:hypothetical protein KQX54_020079 [Cotesia glomerata]